MTVLFCDLVRFTAAPEAADPEGRPLPYPSLPRPSRHEIELYGGTVEKARRLEAFTR